MTIISDVNLPDNVFQIQKRSKETNIYLKNIYIYDNLRACHFYKQKWKRNGCSFDIEIIYEFQSYKISNNGLVICLSPATCNFTYDVCCISISRWRNPFHNIGMLIKFIDLVTKLI